MTQLLLIKQARLRSGELTDILIENGRFARIAPNLNAERAEVIDAHGCLATPPFCDPHLHLDATLSIGRPRYNMSGTLLEVRDAVKEFADLQLVAFPQDCIFTFPEAPALMEQAMEAGADVVGGLPYFELCPEDGIRDIRFVFDLAERFGAMVDIHCDENTDDQSRYVEYIAREAIVRGMGARVTASHTTAMHTYNNDYASKVIGNISRAGMNMITNPFANSCLQNRTDGYPRRRGHTRVDELLAAGVNVAIGSDDIMDPWYPMGKGSPLCGAQLLMNYAQLSGYSQVPQLFDMITVNPARLLMLDGYGIAEGNPANLVILDAESEFDAIRLTSEALYVICNGRILCRTVPAQRKLTVGGVTEYVDFKLKSEH